MFVQVTVVPAGMVSGLGLNALDPSVAAPVGIETVVVYPGGALGVAVEAFGVEGAIGELTEL